jgi:hypothetical protein
MNLNLLEKGSLWEDDNDTKAHVRLHSREPVRKIVCEIRVTRVYRLHMDHK